MRQLLEYVKVRGAGYGQIHGVTVEENPEYEILLKGECVCKRFSECELMDDVREGLIRQELICVKDMGDVLVWVPKPAEPEYEEFHYSSGNGAAMRTYLKVVK